MSKSTIKALENALGPEFADLQLTVDDAQGRARCLKSLCRTLWNQHVKTDLVNAAREAIRTAANNERASRA